MPDISLSTLLGKYFIRPTIIRKLTDTDIRAITAKYNECRLRTPPGWDIYFEYIARIEDRISNEQT